MQIGDYVKYVDQFGKEHDALVTAIWGIDSPMKSLNLVYVVDDETKTDQYGRQIERFTSVVHRDNQAAHGRYWFEV